MTIRKLVHTYRIPTPCHIPEDRNMDVVYCSVCLCINGPRKQVQILDS